MLRKRKLQFKCVLLNVFRVLMVSPKKNSKPFTHVVTFDSGRVLRLVMVMRSFKGGEEGSVWSGLSTSNKIRQTV